MTKCELCREEKAIARYVVPAAESDRGHDIPVLACEKCLKVPSQMGWKITPLKGVASWIEDKIENVIKTYGGSFKHEWGKTLSTQYDGDSCLSYDLMRCEKCGAEFKRYGLGRNQPPELGCSKKGE